jgi:hypothetical protein
LVRNEDVLDAGASEDLGFGNLLTADAAGSAELLLKPEYVDGFVHLAMSTMTHTVRPGVFSHLADVSFERIEIEYQTGRLDFAHAHSRERGNIISDFEIG